MPVFGQIWPFLGQKANFFEGWSKTFGTLISGKSIFCMVIAIFVNGAYHQYTRGYNFPIRTAPKKNSVSKLGVIFRGSPLFLAALGLCHDRGISTLILDRFQQNLVEPSGPSKKWPRMTTDPVWARITEKRTFYVQLKSVFWPKLGFNPKNHPKFLKRLIFIWEKATFFFEQLLPVVARTWLRSRSVCFSVFGPKIQFLPHDPNFGQRRVCSPRSDRSFPTLGTIFRLSVPELQPFS